MLGHCPIQFRIIIWMLQIMNIYSTKMFLTASDKKMFLCQWCKNAVSVEIIIVTATIFCFYSADTPCSLCVRCWSTGIISLGLDEFLFLSWGHRSWSLYEYRCILCLTLKSWCRLTTLSVWLLCLFLGLKLYIVVRVWTFYIHNCSM